MYAFFQDAVILQTFGCVDHWPADITGTFVVSMDQYFGCNSHASSL